MSEYDNSSEDQSTNGSLPRKSRWNWYRMLLVAVPTAIPVVYFYLSGKDHWALKDLALVGGMFVGYWVMVLFVAARVMRHRHAQAITMASPLIEYFGIQGRLKTVQGVGEIAQIFADRGPVIIPFFAPVIGAVSDRVQGLDMNPFPGLTDFRGVSVTE